MILRFLPERVLCCYLLCEAILRPLGTSEGKGGASACLD